MNKISVLHLEDESNDSEMIMNEFLKAGYKINLKRVYTEEKFTDLLQKDKFDIIIADYNLPTYDGISALKYCNKNYSGIPFLIVSGTLNEEKAVQLLKLGASDYILKQNLKRLVSAAEHAINEKKLIQEKKKSENDLKASEEKYRNIFENVQDVYYQINSDGKIIEISPSVKKVSGYSREELIGKHSEIFYSSLNERKQLHQAISSLGEIWDYEIRLKAKDGIEKFVSVNAHLMYDSEGNPVGIEGTLRDIENRKQFELELEKAKNKAEESDRLKTAFLNNISHEIRTPMNAIIGFSDLLGDPYLSDENRQSFIRAIQEGANQLLSIMTDIIDISHIQANIIRKNIHSVNINSTLQSLLKQFQLKHICNDNSIELVLGLTDENANIQTDSIRLIQIISNLMGNAIKFTTAGKIKFGYYLKEQNLEFFVSDTGIGIEENQHTKIFESFYQVDNGPSRKYGGTGLGLAICLANINLQGGKIWLTSEVEKGTTFYFTIPYEPTVISSVNRSKKEILQDIEKKGQLTILIAEDDDINYYLMHSVLQSTDFSVKRAVNGKEAVKAIKSGDKIDLVLMDVRMPVMDGLEATRQIRKIYPTLPVIAQTAYVAEKEKALLSGCTDIISKPFKKDELLSIISKHIHG